MIAAEFREEAGTSGACFIIDGAEIFYPGVDYWDLDGFVKEFYQHDKPGARVYRQ